MRNMRRTIASSFATVTLACCCQGAFAQSPSVLYTWNGTGNVQGWVKNFGTNNASLSNTTPGELTIIETGTAGPPNIIGKDLAISDGANRVRETPAGPSGGTDLLGLDFLEFDLGHNGSGPVNVQFFVQASTGFNFVPLGPDVAVAPGVNTYQLPITGLTDAQAVYVRTIGFNVRDHLDQGNLTWTLREVRSGGTPLVHRTISNSDGNVEGGLDGAIVNFDGASVQGNAGQNQTGLSYNPAGTGSIQWTDVAGGAGGAISWGNGTPWSGNSFNNRPTDASNYSEILVRISATDPTGAGGTVNVQQFFQVNNFGSFLPAGTQALPIDGQYHDLVFSLAGLANMNVIDQLGINLGTHTNQLTINVDLVQFIPEPAAMCAAALVGLALVRRRVRLV